MEISFDSRDISVYREFSRQTRRTQENVECVVPDTDADMEKIASVQSEVFLKSKDLSARGVMIAGELTASVLYIRDGQTGLSFIRVKKPFSMEFETECPDSETLAQISLLIQACDVRVVNPRKIAVSFEVEGELCCYREESLCVESSLPQNAQGLHGKTEECTLTLPNAVCEKSVAVNEQFIFPEGSLPDRLVSERSQLYVTDAQLIGSKVIVKGSAEISLCALTESGELLSCAFSAPFSQIVDVGVESMSGCAVRPEITGAYFNLIDTIKGEKALDAELHAVLQLVCSDRRDISTIADAYSNLMPAELLRRTESLALAPVPGTRKLQKAERVALMEECGALLGTLASPVRLSSQDGKLSAAVNVDFLYQNAEGRLSAARRTISLEMQTDEPQLRILRAGPVQLSARIEGEYVDCAAELTLECLTGETAELSSVTGVVLDEERAYHQESLPTLTLVRRGGESLWTLARKYHSSEEKIRELNEDPETTTRMLLIPKCI